jgi:hypothetical protein
VQKTDMSWLSCCLPIIIAISPCPLPRMVALLAHLMCVPSHSFIRFLSPADLRRMRSTCSFWRGDSHASLLLPSCYFLLQLSSSAARSEDAQAGSLVPPHQDASVVELFPQEYITTLGIEEKDNLNSQKPMRNLWRRGTLRNRLVTSCSDPCSNSM